MNQTPRSHRPWWRFSLRELLLVMLAAAAFIAWGTLLYRTRQFKPSPFFNKNENWEQDVIAVFQELDEPPYATAADTMMHSEGTSSVERTMVFQIPLSPKKKQAFLHALVAKLREKMRQDDCKSTGESGSSSSNNDVSILGYQRGPISGTVQICVSSIDVGKVGVVVTMQEGQGINAGFGLESR